VKDKLINRDSRVGVLGRGAKGSGQAIKNLLNLTTLVARAGLIDGEIGV